jgi:hypothetical protein
MRARDKGRLPPFLPLLNDTLDSPAWRAMSHGARSLYVALKRRYSTNFKNNGKIYLGTRDAAKELGSGLEEIGNWFRELQHYGFIVMTTPGCLGVEGVGKAPHWRLTELGYMKDLPTKDFMRWDGAKFKRQPPRRKQNPDTESRINLIRKAGSPLIRKAGSVRGTSDTESRIINTDPTDTESRIITRLTTSGAPVAPISPPWTAPVLREVTCEIERAKIFRDFDCVSSGPVYARMPLINPCAGR